jgi:hypothetical protein
MYFLILNVSNDGWDHGMTHAERAVALLPREMFTLFAGPSRRVRFNRKDRLGERQRRRKLEKKMNVVVRSSDRVR